MDNTRMRHALTLLLASLVSAGISFAADTEAKRPRPAKLPMTAEKAQKAQKRWAKFLAEDVVTTNRTGMKMTAEAPQGPSDGDRWIIRGGSLRDGPAPSHSRSTMWGPELCMYHIGFRVVCEQPQKR